MRKVYLLTLTVKIKDVMSIPQITSPLVKGIRTSEGILIYLVNLVLGVGTFIDPSKLPPSVAGVLVTVLTVSHLIARTGIKVTAAQHELGIAPPADPQPSIDELATAVAGKVGGGPTINEIRDLIELAVARGIKNGGLGDSGNPPAPTPPVAPPPAP